MIVKPRRRAVSLAGSAVFLATFSALFAGACVSFTPPVSGAEPAQEFLRRLREEGYHDTALDYLDQMANSPLVPATFKETIGYERGVTLMDGARRQRDAVLRDKQFDAAQTAFDQFIAANAKHPMLFNAKSELGNIMIERANFKIDRAARPAEPQKDKLKAEALALYTQAQKLFDGLGDDLREKLKEFPPALKEKDDPKRFELRELYRSQYLEAELLAANVLEKSSDAMTKGSKEYNDRLTAAANAYGEINKKYRQRLAGLYARMNQGYCFQKMGNLKEALSYYEELLANPEEPKEFHDLRTKVLLLCVDCWLHDSQKKYGEVITKAGTWIEKAYPAEMRSNEMQALRMATARASKLMSDQVKAQKPKDPQVTQLLSDARKLAQFVSKSPSNYQKDAQKLLVELGVVAASSEGDKPDPKTFAEARSAAKEALDAINVARASAESLPGRIKEEKDETVRKELEEQLKQAQETLKSSGEAHRLFKLALRLVNSETTDDEINAVRYYITFLDYTSGAYVDAAVLGEYIARRFPESAAARSAGELAMASYIKMYGDAKAETKPNIDKLLGDYDKNKDNRLARDEVDAMPDEVKLTLAGADVDGNGKIEMAELVRLQTRFESERIIDICNYITGRWPDQPEGQKALTTLIDFMISENQLDKAVELLGKIPEDTAFRGTAELKLGQALWGGYLRGMQATHDQEAIAEKAGGVDAATKTQLEARREELKSYKTRAEKILTDGVSRMEKAGKIDTPVFAAAVLSLAQIYVDTEQAAKAIPLLEKENTGALWMAQKKSPLLDKPQTIEETYKTALRAYISALSTAKGDAATEMIKKAEGVMGSLNESVAGQPNGPASLFRIYYSLAKDIERQMQLAEPDTRKNLALGFETFLNQVRATAAELNVLYWVASTFNSMGENAPVGPNGQLNPEAKRYYGEAAKTFEDILARGKAGKLMMDDQMRGQISMQLATSKRAMGDYEGAIKLFMEILTKSNTLLSVQAEACRTYEEWAEKGGDSKYYLQSMQGSLDKKPKGTIWGWSQISTITAGKPQFRDSFYDARYHISLARYKYGLDPKNAAKKKEHLEAAEQALAKTVQLYPNLAGDPAQKQRNFIQQYDALAKLLQQALNKPVKGLAAYEAAPGGAAPAGAAPAGVAPAGAGAPAGAAPAAAKK